jgi:MerR family redox-sensitive transcriptional activator SoxR
MRDLNIGEVSELSGVPASALRYYEERGLIRSIGRRGLRRLFDPNVLQQLTLIRAGQAAGFSLDDLAGIFVSDNGIQIDRQALAAKADELTVMIRRLQGLRDGLRHAAACPETSHMNCPKFRSMIAKAAASVRREDRRGAKGRPLGKGGRQDSLPRPLRSH